MKTFFKIILMVFALTIFSSCESTDLDLQQNPLSVTPESADPDFVLNGMIVGAVNQHLTLSQLTDGVVRHNNQFGTYTNNIAGLTSNSMNGAWLVSYQLMSNLNLLKDLSNENNLPHHVGIAKILNAFEMVNLIDYLGAASYSEAINPDEFPAPGLDDGEALYANMILLLEEAISNLNETASFTPADLFYNGNIDSWKKLANSLIIRMYVQTWKADNFDAVTASQKINAIVSSGMYIKEVSDDFQAQFGTNVSNPDTRHPLYQRNYLGAPNGYMSNDFLRRMLFDKSIEDPRLKHYIYRQTALAPNDPALSENFISDCVNGGFPISDCNIEDGYWGRIHADESGVINDNLLRATYGAYPAGGAFDNDTFTVDNFPINDEGTIEFDTYGPRGDGVLDDFNSILNASNLAGAGIHPMITSSLMNFLLAEAVLFIPGVNGDAAALLSNGMNDSFSKVSAFTGQPMNALDLSTYTTEVNNNFSTASNDDDKLAIIINESYIASFGNSVDAYNAYRRTGFPNFGISFQNPGTFPRSMFLPNSEVIANDNPDFDQKLLTDQVFWDTNPAGFIE